MTGWQRKARQLLPTLGVLVATAGAGGMALAGFATGGEIGGVARYERSATPLGANPQALVPDSHAGAEPLGGLAYGSAHRCMGCGPGLAERRAAVSMAAYEAEYARSEADLDRAQFAPEPVAVEYAFAEPVIETRSELEVIPEPDSAEPTAFALSD